MASGITFRHQQNPSLNGGPPGEDSLKSFYGYKETFGKGTQWVDIPRTLQFVHISNPYEDREVVDEGDSSFRSQQLSEDGQQDHDYPLNPALYTSYATHGLEALSAVASDQYSYAPPQPSMSSAENPSSDQKPTTASPQYSQATPLQNLDYILNPDSALSPQENNIDPQLHAQTANLAAALQNATQVRTCPHDCLMPSSPLEGYQE